MCQARDHVWNWRSLTTEFVVIGFSSSSLSYLYQKYHWLPGKRKNSNSLIASSLVSSWHLWSCINQVQGHTYIPSSFCGEWSVTFSETYKLAYYLSRCFLCFCRWQLFFYQSFHRNCEQCARYYRRGWIRFLWAKWVTSTVEKWWIDVVISCFSFHSRSRLERRLFRTLVFS